MEERKLVAWNLRRLRVAKELSQEKLAADTNIDRAYVGRLERGRENPTVLLLARLSRALSVHISAFFVVPKPGESAPKSLPKGRHKTKPSRPVVRQRAGVR